MPTAPTTVRQALKLASRSRSRTSAGLKSRFRPMIWKVLRRFEADSGRHRDRGRRIRLHHRLCPQNAGSACCGRAASRHDAMRRRDRLSCRSRPCVRPFISTCPVIALRRCIFTSHAPLRGCATLNGFTITFVSNTCCSTGARCPGRADPTRSVATRKWTSSSKSRMQRAMRHRDRR